MSPLLIDKENDFLDFFNEFNVIANILSKMICKYSNTKEIVSQLQLNQSPPTMSFLMYCLTFGK